MNTGQMLLTIGALMLLGLVVLRVNNGFLNTNSVLYDTKLGILAISYASSIIEEASAKAFDEATAAAPTNMLSDLTKAGMSYLGPEGESYDNFDDFDDYNGYQETISDTSMAMAEYDIFCRVHYVDPNTGGSLDSVNYRTWYKKITVYISSPSMYGQDSIPDTIEMSSIYSYWYFR